MNLSNLITVIRSGGSFISELARKMFPINVFKTYVKQDDNNGINEILLYGAENEEHMKQIGLNNLLCIYYIILNASKSVDICVPSFISDTLAKSLIIVQQNNKIKIRITIHNSENFNNLQLFAQNGIEVKIISPTVRLEHEFLLIDASENVQDAVAVMGSIDYATTRLNCNRDATVLTSEATVITALKREFDRVWNSVSEQAFVKDDKWT